MSAKKNSINVDFEVISKTLADSLDKSGQPFGGAISADEDALFAQMLEETDEEDDAGDVLDDKDAK